MVPVPPVVAAGLAAAAPLAGETCRDEREGDDECGDEGDARG